MEAAFVGLGKENLGPRLRDKCWAEKGKKAVSLAFGGKAAALDKKSEMRQNFRRTGTEELRSQTTTRIRIDENVSSISESQR
jgi:hypothetical protein